MSDSKTKLISTRSDPAREAEESPAWENWLEGIIGIDELPAEDQERAEKYLEERGLNDE